MLGRAAVKAHLPRACISRLTLLALPQHISLLPLRAAAGQDRSTKKYREQAHTERRETEKELGTGVGCLCGKEERAFQRFYAQLWNPWPGKAKEKAASV